MCFVFPVNRYNLDIFHVVGSLPYVKDLFRFKSVEDVSGR